MGAVVEQQPFANGLAGAQGDEAGGAAIGRFLNRHRAVDQDGEPLARLSLAEDQRIGLQRGGRDVARQLPEVRFREVLEEGGATEALGDFGGSGHGPVRRR